MSRGQYPILLMLAMSLPGAVKALGLGDIRVDSALNEPLSAQIDIVGATREELIALTAKIANRDVFQRYGADRPTFLATATFKVGVDSQGRPVLNVRSAEAFTDPVVSFLVDLRWGNGELIREYSLLLDPAGFSPATRLAAAPAAADDRPTAAAPPAPASGIDPRVAAMTQSSPSRTRPAKAVAETVPADLTAPATHRVAAHDTLRGIVRRTGVKSEVLAQRMMIAIFRANSHAFEGNINRLHLGAVLTLPSADEVEAIDANQAKREVRAQMTAWRLEGRPGTTEHAASAASTPASAPATADVPPAPHSPVADAGSSEMLRGRVQSLEQALNDLQKQLVSETATIQDLKKLTLQAVPHEAAPAVAPTPAVAAAPAVAAPPTVAAAPAAHAATAAPAPVVEVMHADPRPEPVLAAVASPSSQPSVSRGMVGLVGGAMLLVLGGFAYTRRRALKALEMHGAAAPESDHDETAVVEQAPIVRASEPAPAARSAEPPKTAPAPRTEISAPVPRETRTPAPVASDQTTQELAIDTEALERSYLDALAIDTLGIDMSDTGKNITGSHAAAEAAALPDAEGMDTVAVDASELDTAIEQADLHTAIIAVKKPDAAALNSTSLDYNLLDLDATAEHVQTQHVQMPSALNDHVVVSERRMNIVDVLKTAIDRDPHRRDLRMKLLETYYSAAAINRRAFIDVVKKLSRERELLTPDDWKQVMKMGREIAPDDILFADPNKDNLADCA